jgi:hypothetical protein
MVCGMIQRLLVVVGITLVAAALIVGFGVSVYAPSTDCGSAFMASDAASNQESRGDLGCDYVRSQARGLPLALLVVGLGLGAGSFAVRTKERRPVTAQAAR